MKSYLSLCTDEKLRPLGVLLHSLYKGTDDSFRDRSKVVIKPRMEPRDKFGLGFPIDVIVL